MKRVLPLLLVFLLLTGCGKNNSELDQAMDIRDRLLKSNGCKFDAVITADYGEKVYTFSMYCESDSKGDLVFRVTDPETISGITGTVSQNGGNLTFDNQALAFELLADGQVTPVSAPWLLIHTLRSGYLTFCGKDGDTLHIVIDDSYADDALQLDIWTDANGAPIRGEILWKGRRVLSMDVRNFTYA